MMKVQIHPLPPKLVQLLEEKQKLNGKLGPQGIKIWSDLMPSLLRTYYNFRALASHEALEELGEKLAQTLDRLQKTVQVPDKHREFTADCFRVYALMDEYVKTRAQLEETHLPAVNGLIHAIHAHLRGHLHGKLLEVYGNSARAAVDDLVTLYKATQDGLEEPVKQAFLKGIDSFTQAFRELQTLEPVALKNCLVNLKNGATLLEHLARWREEFEGANRSPVPVVGDYVSEMQRQLREQGALAPETLNHWLEEEFWNLQERWAKTRHDLFMPRAKKDRIVERLDSLMLNLRDLDQVTPAAQAQLLANLETQYEALSGNGFDVAYLRTHPAGWLADLFAAVLAKGVPSYKIREVIQEFEGTDYHNYSVYLSKYLQEEDRDYILDALAQLEMECDQREAESKM